MQRYQAYNLIHQTRVKTLALYFNTVLQLIKHKKHIVVQ